MAEITACELLAPTGPVAPGERVQARVRVTVDNIQSAVKSEVNLEATLGGRVFATAETTVETGGRRELILSGEVVLPTEVGDYDAVVDITSQRGLDTGANLDAVQIVSLSASKSTPAPGENVSIQSTLRNTGNAEVDAGLAARGSSSIRFLGPGETQDVNVSVGSFSTPGQKTIEVTLTDGSSDGETRSVVVNVEEPAPEPDPDPVPDPINPPQRGGGGGTNDPEPDPEPDPDPVPDPINPPQRGGGGGTNDPEPDPEPDPDPTPDPVIDPPQRGGGGGTNDPEPEPDPEPDPISGRVPPGGNLGLMSVEDVYGGARRSLVYRGRSVSEEEDDENGGGRRSSGVRSPNA